MDLTAPEDRSVGLLYKCLSDFINIFCFPWDWREGACRRHTDRRPRIASTISGGRRDGPRRPARGDLAQELSGERLQRLNSHNVADALRYFSGIQIKDYGGVGGLKTVNIRSMGTNHVGVFYDGIELGNAQNGTVDLGRFSLDNMESVTLYNGQK